MKSITKILIILSTLFFAQMASAGDCLGTTCTNRVVTEIRSTYRRVTFQVAEDVAKSCSYFGRQFRLELKNSDGTPNFLNQAVYASLLSFVGQRKKVTIWFNAVDENLWGKDQTSGCTQNGMGEVTGVLASFSPSEYPADELGGDEQGPFAPATEDR